MNRYKDKQPDIHVFIYFVYIFRWEGERDGRFLYLLWSFFAGFCNLCNDGKLEHWAVDGSGAAEGNAGSSRFVVVVQRVSGDGDAQRSVGRDVDSLALAEVDQLLLPPERVQLRLLVDQNDRSSRGRIHYSDRNVQVGEEKVKRVSERGSEERECERKWERLRGRALDRNGKLGWEVSTGERWREKELESRREKQ